MIIHSSCSHVNFQFNRSITLVHIILYRRVESGSDDPDNVGHLGHFFDGSSGSHPQTKLSGCDPVFVRIWQHMLSK